MITRCPGNTGHGVKIGRSGNSTDASASSDSTGWVGWMSNSSTVTAKQWERWPWLCPRPFPVDGPVHFMELYCLYDVLRSTAIAKDSDLAWPSHVDIMWTM